MTSESQIKAQTDAQAIAKLVEDTIGLKMDRDKDGNPKLILFFLTRDKTGRPQMFHMGNVNDDLLIRVNSIFLSDIFQQAFDNASVKEEAK